MRKHKGSQQCTGKLVFFFFLLKLTYSTCRMFRSADTKASDDGFSMPATRGHASSRSPSTHLFSLCDPSHSSSTRWASRLFKSLRAGVPHTQVLIFVPPSFVKKGGGGGNPRGHLSLTKQLNPMAQKSQYNFLAHQSPL
jgi:hypothetical protein